MKEGHSLDLPPVGFPSSSRGMLDAGHAISLIHDSGLHDISPQITTFGELARRSRNASPIHEDTTRTNITRPRWCFPARLKIFLGNHDSRSSKDSNHDLATNLIMVFHL